MTRIPWDATKKVAQAGGFNFHSDASESTQKKFVGQTKTTVHGAFTKFIYDMLTVLSFLPSGFFPPKCFLGHMLHSTYLGSGKSGNPLYHSFPMSVPYEALWQVYICFLWCQLFGLIKTCFLHSVLAVTCFCSFHKKARLLVFSSGRCTAITALLWRSAGHAVLCTHTKASFLLSYSFPIINTKMKVQSWSALPTAYSQPTNTVQD